MSFEEYLSEKNIDSGAFEKHESQKYSELRGIFEQMHPSSFTEQKRFLINDLRRQYQLVDFNKVAK